MRKRNVQILFRLTEEEAEYLCSLAERTGRSRQALLQSMVMGYRLCEKPDPEFYKIMRELSAIGNRINQLAAKANGNGHQQRGGTGGHYHGQLRRKAGAHKPANRGREN